ncbi:MAG: hypothetical protein FWE19_00460 [Oscillospiraceae bacterium]|nr:hypothetical protein [Oscillospiraceae bacterium]
MSRMRAVAGSYKVYDGGWKVVDFEMGYFHGWGQVSTEFENGGVTDTIAIVELPDGSIVTPAPGDIRFLDAVEVQQ